MNSVESNCHFNSTRNNCTTRNDCMSMNFPTNTIENYISSMVCVSFSHRFVFEYFPRIHTFYWIISIQLLCKQHQKRYWFRYLINTCPSQAIAKWKFIRHWVSFRIDFRWRLLWTLNFHLAAEPLSQKLFFFSDEYQFQQFSGAHGVWRRRSVCQTTACFWLLLTHFGMTFTVQVAFILCRAYHITSHHIIRIQNCV